MSENGANTHIGKKPYFPAVKVVPEDFRRPREFEKKSGYPEDSEEDRSVVGKMPPSEDSDASV